MSVGTSSPEICSSQTVIQSVWRNIVIHTPTWRYLIFPCHNNIISGALVDDKQRGSLQARLDALFVFFCCFFLLGPQTMSLLCRPSGWVHSHQSCSFPCVGQNRFLATGVNSCTLMGKALRKCTTKRNYSKQVWKHSSVVTGRGGSGALVFTTYVHSSALTVTLYLHLWATFTCACVCVCMCYCVCVCVCVTGMPSALATTSGFDLQSDTYIRNTNK